MSSSFSRFRKQCTGHPAAALWALAPALILSAAPLLAHEAALEEILVTAQKRAESIQDLPISVTAFSADAMKALGFDNSLQLAAQTPGLQTAQSFGEGNIPVISIRGVSMVDFSEHNESPSAVYVDEFYKANLSGLDFQLFDLERAEVLRGPQGTLFGRNATGGLLHYITVKPGPEADNYAEVSVGERGRIKAESAVGGAIGESVFTRLSTIYHRHDGYFDNEAPAREDGNQLDMWGARGQIAVDAGDAFEALLSLQAGRNRNDGGNPYHHLAATQDAVSGLAVALPDPAWVSDNKRTVNTDYQSTLDTDVHSGLLRLSHTLGERLQLVSLTGFEHLEKSFSNDTDASPVNAFQTFFESNGDEFSQEIRLHGEELSSRWVLGIYYMTYRNEGEQHAMLGDFARSSDVPSTLFETVDWDMQTDTLALFGQYEYDMTDQLTGVIGLRFSDEDKRFEATWESATANPDRELEFTRANQGDLTRFESDNLSYNLRLNYSPTPDVLLYLSNARAFKAGTFNMGFFPLADVDSIPVDEEQLTSYEFGFKLTMGNGLARLNGAIFHYDYDDHQAFAFDSTALSNYLFNNDARVNGAELELFSSPANGWDIVLGLAYLDTTLNQVQDPGGDGLGGTTYDRHMAMAPEFTANALLRYSFNWLGGEASLQADAAYTANQYFDAFNSPAMRADGYTVTNLRASWHSIDARWSTSVFVENVSNEEGQVFALT